MKKNRGNVNIGIIFLFIIVIILGICVGYYFGKKTRENENSKNNNEQISNQVSEQTSEQAKITTIDVDSKEGSKIQEYLGKVQLEVEMFDKGMDEFDNIKEADKRYLAICSAFEVWDGDDQKAKFEEFNDALVKLFGKEADGYLSKSDIENVFFVHSNEDGTYEFMGFDGSETEGFIRRIKKIEKQDDSFIVEVNEFHIKDETMIFDLAIGETMKEFIYDMNGNLITEYTAKSVQVEENTVGYEIYNKDGENIESVADDVFKNYEEQVSVRRIELKYDKENDSFYMINNKLIK